MSVDCEDCRKLLAEIEERIYERDRYKNLYEVEQMKAHRYSDTIWKILDVCKEGYGGFMDRYNELSK